jgi:hypothetical protein
LAGLDKSEKNNFNKYRVNFSEITKHIQKFNQERLVAFHQKSIPQ